MKKITVILITLLMLSVSCNAFFTKVITIKIYDEGIEKVVLSPNRERLLIINDREEIVLFDVQKEVIITRYDMVTEDYVIYKHSVDWVNSNKIELTKHYKCPEEKAVRYITEDLTHFELLFQYDEKIKYRGNIKNMLIQDIDSKRIKIKYSNNEIWDTGWQLDFTGYSWSNDDKYLLLSHSKTKENYLIDTSKKTIRKLEKYFSGKWSPTRNLYCFYTNFEARNFQEKGIYVFNAEDLSFVKFNTDIDLLENLSRTWSPTFIWSPNSRYIVIPDVGEMFLFDVSSPLKKPQVLLELDGQIDEKRVTWSKDLKHVLLSYETRSINVLKPFNFYVARVNIDTGKIERIYIPGLLYKEFFWIDDNTIIYRVDHDNGLYKSKLKWRSIMNP